MKSKKLTQIFRKFFRNKIVNVGEIDELRKFFELIFVENFLRKIGMNIRVWKEERKIIRLFVIAELAGTDIQINLLVNDVMWMTDVMRMNDVMRMSDGLRVKGFVLVWLEGFGYRKSVENVFVLPNAGPNLLKKSLRV